MVLLATSPPTSACTLKLTVGQDSPPHLPQQEVLGWLELLPHLVEDGEVLEATVLEATGAMAAMAATVVMATVGSEGAVVVEEGASGAGGGERMAITGAAAKIRARVAVGSSRASSKERLTARVNSRVRISRKSHRSRMETTVTKTRNVLGQAQPLAPAPSWTWSTMDQTHSRLLKRHNKWPRRLPSKHTASLLRWPLNTLPM